MITIPEAVLIVLMVLVAAVMVYHYGHAQKKAAFCSDRARGAAVQSVDDTHKDPNDLMLSYRGQNYVTAEDIFEAERGAWFAAEHDTLHNYDVAKSEPGEDVAQYHNALPPTDYQTQLVEAGIDEDKRRKHAEWAAEVKPFSQTSMVVDDMDEAVYMNSRKGWGITTFRRDTPAQGLNTLFVTEADPYLYAKHSSSLVI